VSFQQVTLDSLSNRTHGNIHSRRAAESMLGRMGSIRRRVLREIAEAGPISAEGLELGMGISGNTIRPTILSLREAGLVAVVGEGVTTSGRTCGLYGITEAGRRVLPELVP
jgi:predicted ArsR family transcriptional regulator